MENQDTGIPANPGTLPLPAGPERRHPQWWLAVQSALIAYGLTLGAALVTMALLVLGFFLGGTGALNGMNDSAGTMGARLDGPSALLIYPFFLAAMALGGTPVLTVSSAGFASLPAPLVSLWAGAMPLLLTGVAGASLWRLGRRAERRRPLDSEWHRWLYSALTGLVLAAVSVLLSLLVSLRENTEAGAMFLTAASPGLVAGAVLLGTAASWAGRKHGTGSAPRWAAWTERTLPGVRAALRVTGSHYLAYTAAAGTVLVVTALVKGGAAVAFASPLWLPTASAWAYSLGHLSAVTERGLPAAAGLPGSIGDLPVWASAATGVLSLLLAAAASVAWFLARDGDPDWLGRRSSWLTLPVVFGFAGAAVSLLAVVAAGQTSAGAGGSFGTAGPAPWTFLVMAAWGLLIEAGARIMAGHVEHLVPAWAAAFFRKAGN
ncbi:hypothetical protein OL239_01305 [Arthrobacter sp. ATA002]|uniref:hypothetical protein n=1 Tax=Arthrobacter sp. ATA002 TaxID=2991715 RepID=UPI0022A6A206|nr:hypothetical protein [Arthrobacter sp. ATA002]WAP52002.1 hypothetical protein OL239_01305 [Arthrobacter sp. ATA002]